MAIEEKEWLNTQSPVADTGSELEGKEVDGERRMEKAVNMKTDILHYLLRR
jgi:hypothetical protein